MSNGSDEIADIRKRLEEIERAVNELRTGDLAIMKTMAAELCEMYYYIFTLFQKAEEVKKYTELWAKRLAETKRTIQGSETSEAVIGTRDKFVKDLVDYTKAEKAPTAEEAMDIAYSFMKKDCSVALPLKAERQDDIWLVDIDIGAVKVEIVRVKLDAKTGDILGQETVERK
jgi:hypothetical protein